MVAVAARQTNAFCTTAARGGIHPLFEAFFMAVSLKVL
jgi:hypothetical protein